VKVEAAYKEVCRLADQILQGGSDVDR